MNDLQIIVDELGGFCFGVRRAIEKAEALLEKGPLNSYGPIIHNPHVVNELASRGLRVVDKVGDSQNAPLVIRAHGVPQSVYEKAHELGVEIEDATCPCVKRIHDLVMKHHREGSQVIIIGEREHPEVIGANGWCGGKALVLGGPEEADAVEPFEGDCIVVSQTTIDQNVFDQTIEVLKQKGMAPRVFNTICTGNAAKFKSAEELAARVDGMVIIGGRHSSNTRKLFNIGKKYCSYAILVEDADELDINALEGINVVGVTAGASTPDRIIKEVISKMSEIEEKGNVNPEQGEETQEIASVTENEVQAAPEETVTPEETAASAAEAEEPQESMADDLDSNFAEAFEKTMVRIRNGQIITGSVVQVTENEVCVNIGYKSDGFIPRSELSFEDVNPLETVKVGDMLEVEVLKVNDGEGNVLLSKKNIDTRKNWETVVEKAEADEIFEGVGKEIVKGGMIATVLGIRAFIPASHVGINYVGKLDKFIGKPMKLCVLEVDKARKRLIASSKVALEREFKEKKHEIIESLEPGSVLEGTVRRVTDFGVFVDIGGVDGLIHVSDLSWNRVPHPSDVLKSNQKVSVKILSVDKERERISLGYKQLFPKPWEVAPEKYPVGSYVTGKVVRIVTFGAFIELEPGLDGLCHISQASQKRPVKVEDVLQEGQVVTAKVLEVNPERKRISLSIRSYLDEQGYTDDLQDTSPLDDDDLSTELPEFTPASTTLADVFPELAALADADK